jgi:hypothetical protein
MDQIEHKAPAEAREGEIIGKPTLMAIYTGRQDANRILDGLKSTGYPLDDVSVYYRPDGTDQVIDAVTGEVAAGQSLNEKDLKNKQLQNVQTVVLMHPEQNQYQSVRQVLASIGTADIKYSGITDVEGRPGGVERHDETPQAQA